MGQSHRETRSETLRGASGGSEHGDVKLEDKPPSAAAALIDVWFGLNWLLAAAV